jgi:hypothetical protein
MGEHYGPDVVWLLDVDTPGDHDHGLTGSVYDKRVVRFTVEVPAIRWFDWAPATEMHPAWRGRLIKLGGGMEAAGHWYVFPRGIPANHWREIAILTETRGGPS